VEAWVPGDRARRSRRMLRSLLGTPLVETRRNQSSRKHSRLSQNLFHLKHLDHLQGYLEAGAEPRFEHEAPTRQAVWHTSCGGGAAKDAAWPNAPQSRSVAASHVGCTATAISVHHDGHCRLRHSLKTSVSRSRVTLGLSLPTQAQLRLEKQQSRSLSG